MCDLTLSSRAYCKIILHAAKYPHCSINGVLLAKADSLKSKNIEFVDAVPLSHIAINLTPLAEIALTQIDYEASNLGLVIAGYYVAHESFREKSIEKSLNRVTEKIAENCNTACLVVVENNKLSYKLVNPALQVAQFSDGKYKLVDSSKVFLRPEHTLDICTSLLEQKMYKEIMDFDNHLDNISSDWKNCNINDKIEDLE